MNDTLIINEIFGPTIQGEGKSAGQRAAFLRTFGCPLNCCYCDSAWTWRVDEKHPHKWGQVFDPKEESHVMTYFEIFKQLIQWDYQVLIITGGEPLVQKKALYEFLTQLPQQLPFVHRVEFETAGIISPGRLLDFPWVSFNVSPKLENSGNDLKSRYKPDVLTDFNLSERAIFKFVVTQPADFDEIEEMIHSVNIQPWKVYIMAEGEKTEDQIEKMKWVAPMAIEKGYNFSPRLHTLIWDTKRGV